MNLRNKKRFILPDLHLASLPTGSVKQLVDTLGRQIARGDFPVGSNMPMEPELVEQHGVSRTVVREAIKVLSGKGLVRTARRYGTRVCNTNEWNLLDPDVVMWHDPDSPMARRIFRDTTEFRLIFEPNAAALAASNATDDQLQMIHDAAKVVDSESESNEHRLAADFAFHATILESTNNLMLKQFVGLMYSILSFTYHTRLVTINVDDIQHPHLLVADRLLQRDAEQAKLAMRHTLVVNESVADRFSS